MAYEIFKALHGLGLLMTVGVITATLVFGKYKKMFPDTKIPFPFKWISPSVKAGLVILIVSGLGMYGENAKELNASVTFWIKMVFVLALIVNNIWLNTDLRPKSKKLSADPALANSPELLKIKKRFKLAENLSLFLWYAATIISVFLPDSHEEKELLEQNIKDFINLNGEGF